MNAREEALRQRLIIDDWQLELYSVGEGMKIFYDIIIDIRINLFRKVDTWTVIRRYISDASGNANWKHRDKTRISLNDICSVRVKWRKECFYSTGV